MEPSNVCQWVLGKMHEMCQAGMHCDASFIVNGSLITAHRVVLAAASPVLQSILSESSTNESHEVEGVSVADMKKLVHFLYTGELKIDRENISIFRDISEQLNIDILRKVCKAEEDKLLQSGNEMEMGMGQTSLSLINVNPQLSSGEAIFPDTGTGLGEEATVVVGSPDILGELPLCENCELCGEQFANAAAAKEHAISEHALSLYQCCHCGARVYPLTECEDHEISCCVQQNKRDEWYHCPECAFFVSKQSADVVLHYKTEHSHKEQKTCEYCSQKIVGNSYAYFEHLLRRHGLRVSCMYPTVCIHQCTECDYQTTQHSNMKQHQKQHPNYITIPNSYSQEKAAVVDATETDMAGTATEETNFPDQVTTDENLGSNMASIAEEINVAGDENLETNTKETGISADRMGEYDVTMLNDGSIVDVNPDAENEETVIEPIVDDIQTPGRISIMSIQVKREESGEINANPEGNTETTEEPSDQAEEVSLADDLTKLISKIETRSGEKKIQTIIPKMVTRSNKEYKLSKMCTRSAGKKKPEASSTSVSQKTPQGRRQGKRKASDPREDSPPAPKRGRKRKPVSDELDLSDIDVGEEVKDTDEFEQEELEKEDSELEYKEGEESENEEKKVRGLIDENCEFCGKNFQRMQTIRVHMRNDHKDQMLTCGICSKKFYLRRHRDNHEERCRIFSQGPINGKYYCPVEGCNVSSTMNHTVRLVRHYREAHTDRQVRVCEHCQITFNGFIPYMEHLFVQHDVDVGKLTSGRVKMHTCDLCDYKTTRSLNYKRHHIQHTGPLLCDVCNKAFNSKWNLEKHKQTVHENYKKLQCEHCGFGTNTKYILEAHIYKQHNILPPNQTLFSCDLCDYTNVYIGAIKRHKRDVHAPRSSFLCTYCPKSFKSMHCLGVHEKKMHTNKKHFDCERCSFTTFKRAEIGKHMAAEHPDFWPYMCHTCGKRFRHAANIKYHMSNCYRQKIYQNPPLAQLTGDEEDTKVSQEDQDAIKAGATVIRLPLPSSTTKVTQNAEQLQHTKTEDVQQTFVHLHTLPTQEVQIQDMEGGSAVQTLEDGTIIQALTDQGTLQGFEGVTQIQALADGGHIQVLQDGAQMQVLIQQDSSQGDNTEDAAQTVLQVSGPGMHSQSREVKVLGAIHEDGIGVPGRLESSAGELDVSEQVDSSSVQEVLILQPDGTVNTVSVSEVEHFQE